MNKIIGFIGAGNMGQTMVGGIVSSKLIIAQDIIISDLNEEKLKIVREKFSVRVTTDSNELAKEADILVLAVKPNLYPIVIKDIKDSIKKEAIVVTIAAGKTLNDTETMFGKRIKIVRAMPNTPALVGEGMSAICPNDLVSKEEIKEVINIFESFGKAEIVEEKLMDAVTSVSGSSPAYVYMFIEAMADAAVLEGMPRDKAYKFAAQAVLGSAKMVLETGMHPGVLKDMVCSPGGTTIKAVSTLEKHGFRNAIIEAVKDCATKSKEMSK
ncbi:pyrroline-5-carboxylate reductase [Clostridium tepidum]|jgi:pyrroline-5-carboxylate reductase|uniref:Pyrroline-5-carboxylate reductase n=1 Tax=Clostridium tepidum TaxID=1962263 RepID=A0A1S9I8B1_9CLOT|nr:pyrroline-5-carboxylate reductase [Clostridium tepidum]MDU6878717.1 pyrroline-5-carboxylate reductase [Clostridium botulinum]OOO61586.1 pyrroline-5-carboxylate reductase [Clostridium tepidum]OOO66571.1 pyrroline-5-carboxylate reductase [Clostridium tepidum]